MAGAGWSAPSTVAAGKAAAAAGGEAASQAAVILAAVVQALPCARRQQDERPRNVQNKQLRSNTECVDSEGQRQVRVGSGGRQEQGRDSSGSESSGTAAGVQAGRQLTVFQKLRLSSVST